mgnify:CR=1 FL=1
MQKNIDIKETGLKIKLQQKRAANCSPFLYQMPKKQTRKDYKDINLDINSKIIIYYYNFPIPIFYIITCSKFI